MDYATYLAITGNTLTSAQQTRFTSHVEPAAVAKLEKLLGYPLDPSDWSNLYNETGKTQTDYICPDDDADLDAPDAVVGKYRLFPYYPTDRYFAIDPATVINKVKLVRNNITYKTFNLDNGEVVDEYAVKWINASTKYAKYLDMSGCYDWWNLPCWRNEHYQIAVDATWGFTTLPLDLQRALADMIADEFDERSDIRSESRGSHSYTKFDDKREIQEKYPVIADYAGPNGLAKVRTL